MNKMKDILIKNTTLAILAALLAAPVMADWTTDPAAESVWSSGIELDNVNLGTEFLISVMDPITFGSDWAYGYDRVSTVRAENNMIRPYYIYRNVYDGEYGKCYWNYADEDILSLPRHLHYTLIHEVKDGMGNVLCHDEAYVTIGSGDPLPPTWSSNYTLDTYNIASGKSIELKPTDYITYSAKWALNGKGFDRKFKLYATDQGASGIMGFFSMSSGDTYDIMTSSVEGEGTYRWNYTSVDPGDLPRGDTYTLNYAIYDNDDPTAIFDTVTSTTSITITPEPSLALMALILFGLSYRKLN